MIWLVLKPPLSPKLTSSIFPIFAGCPYHDLSHFVSFPLEFQVILISSLPQNYSRPFPHLSPPYPGLFDTGLVRRDAEPTTAMLMIHLCYVSQSKDQSLQYTLHPPRTQLIRQDIGRRFSQVQNHVYSEWLSYWHSSFDQFQDVATRQWKDHTHPLNLYYRGRLGVGVHESGFQVMQGL